MNRQPDILAEFTLLIDGRGPTYSGYRPAHAVKDEYLTSGQHSYLETEVVHPGETAAVEITFVTPQHYPSCLWVGKKLRVQEGSRLVGHVVVKEIYNKSLETGEPGKGI